MADETRAEARQYGYYWVRRYYAIYAPVPLDQLGATPPEQTGRVRGNPCIALFENTQSGWAFTGESGLIPDGSVEVISRRLTLQDVT